MPLTATGTWAAARRSLHHGQLLRRRGDDAGGGGADRLGGRCIRIGQHQRLAAVGVLAQLLLKRHLAEQRHVELVGEELAAALAEDRESLAARGREARHVLDHAEDLEVDLGGHVSGPLGDRLRGRLRRCHDHDLCGRQELGQGHRDVASPRGQVEQQVVQLAPVHVLEELGDRLVKHRPAPDDGGVVLEKEPDRHRLDPARRQRRNDLPLSRDLWTPIDAEHPRKRVAVHVGIKSARLLPARGQGGREVGRHRRLPHPSLAGGDADHVLDLCQRPLGQPSGAAEHLLQARTSPRLRARRRRSRPRSRPRGRRPAGGPRSRSGCGSGTPGSSVTRSRPLAPNRRTRSSAPSRDRRSSAAAPDRSRPAAPRLPVPSSASPGRF